MVRTRLVMASVRLAGGGRAKRTRRGDRSSQRPFRVAEHKDKKLAHKCVRVFCSSHCQNKLPLKQINSVWSLCRADVSGYEDGRKVGIEGRKVEWRLGDGGKVGDRGWVMEGMGWGGCGDWMVLEGGL